MAAGPTGPLTDVRVVDLTQALAGPYCTMILADMGADVIKVESPSGDLPRFAHPFHEDDTDKFFGGYFASINRNKRAHRARSEGQPDDVETLMEPARRRRRDRRELQGRRHGPTRSVVGGTARAVPVKLIYATIRGFGDPRTGESPHVDWPAFDIVAQAMGGIVSCTGPDETQRVSTGPSVGDLYPATMCAIGILGALHHARNTGEGQFVDVAMADADHGALRVGHVAVLVRR